MAAPTLLNGKAFDGHAAIIREAIIGSYAEFYIGTLLVGAEKEGVNPLVMELFRESGLDPLSWTGWLRRSFVG